jgi:dethiobiotin synthetase
MIPNHIFVTGTDTEVGKTRISVGLIETLVNQGHRVVGMKPIASGCELTAEGLRNEDALALIQASNVDLPYEQVNPYAFEPAIAPHIAAEQVGVNVSIEHIMSHYQVLRTQADAVVVEGAGGWFVPLNKTETMADLAKALNLPVVLVVAIRLGCINHALLTVEAIRASGLSLAGWVANQPQKSLESVEIIQTLKQHIAAPCLGEVPMLNTTQSATAYLCYE